MVEKDTQLTGERATLERKNGYGPYGFLAGGGEMGERIRAKDWSSSLLGQVESWPQSLQSALSICLNSAYPIALYWGPQLALLYNDTWSPILGNKHPRALGQAGHAVWPEIWDTIGPLFDKVKRTGEGVWLQNELLLMNRHGYVEECYFNYTFSPIRGETGIEGIFNAVVETTYQVINERRNRFLRHLAERTSGAASAREVYKLAAEAIGSADRDIPFALFYLPDDSGKEARLAGAAGLTAGSPAAPAKIGLADEAGQVWPLAELAKSGKPAVVTDLKERFGALPGGAWDESCNTALVLPVARSGQERPYGWLVAGVSPRLALDEEYRAFFEAISGQTATAINNAQAYEEERRRAEALAEIDRAKTTFFSNISHEFRTPLTLMLGPIEDILAEKEKLSSAQQEGAEMLQRNSLRLLRLVNALLDFSRIEAGRVQAVYEPTNLAAFTAELASSFRSAIERAGMELIIDAPPLAEPVYVDREMWEKIVLNLLSNAFKYTLQGTIKVSLRQAGEAVQLSVADNGVGIPEAELGHVFERFHRVEGVEGRTQEGTGIGLALVQELVRLHSGEIGVESRVGQGTTFTVCIPAGTEHLPQERVSGSRKLASTAVGANAYVEEAMRWLGGREELAQAIRDIPFEPEIGRNGEAGKPGSDELPHILVADDNADMREYIKRLLAQMYRVEAVADGQAALEAIEANKPDLVLTDVMMPKLDGFGLLKALRANPRTRTLPVIMLSARAGEEARIEGLDEGADDYLVKPFSARELLARISSHLALARVRQQAEQAAGIERERLYELFMQAPAVIAVLKGPRHVFELANPLYLQLIGQGREVIGKTVAETLPEVVDQGFIDLLDKVYQTGETFFGNEIPVKLDRNTGGNFEQFYLNFVYQPHRTATGEIQGILVYAVDVSEQVKARQRVEEQNRVLEMITSGASLAAALEFLARSIEKQSGENMRASILLLDKDGKHLRHGAAPDLPEEYNQAIDGIEIGLAVGSCGTAAFTGKPVIVSDIATDPLWDDFRELALRHNLRASWSTPIFSSDQRVLGTFAVYYPKPRVPTDQDRMVIDFATRTAALVIERARAEEALRDSEERFRTLADNISQLAWMADEDGSIYWYNQRWYDYTGTTFESMQGWGWQQVHHPDHVKRVVDKILYHFQTGLEWEDTFPLRSKEGEYRWFLSRAIPIRDAGGKVLRWFGTNTDITERLELEQRRDEFIGIASHELKTPLTSVKGYVQLLERMLSGSDNDKARLYFAKTNIYIDRLNSLIADLLDVSRVQAGKLQFNLSEFDFDELVKEGVDSIQPTATHHKIELVGKAGTTVVGDRNRLEQVLTNLLTNAIKYSPQADRVVVSVSKNQDSVEVAVQDFGIGISRENQAKIFERFYRVESSARGFSGLGIGLYISSEIINRHNGTLSVESEEGKGSIFTFTLPISPD
ncbi:MAG TPA: ATP-binding protein [Chloroflexia bacterium]|nr:ATP-binding protein [Chloroflexia bacterium]